MTERDEQVQAATKRLSDEIELLRREAGDQGLAFSALTEDELVGRESGQTSSSPYIYSQSWTSGTSAGNPAVYRVYVRNPDPSGYYPLFVTIFFGLANFLTDVGHGPAGRDPRWPYVSSAGFSLVSGATTNQTFNYVVPASSPSGTHTGNAVLWRGQYHDQGDYLDRGLFPVTVS